jgi:hypothetical protein
MELKAKPRSRTAARLHFTVRFLLVTALLVAGVGIVLAVAQGIVPRTLDELQPYWQQIVDGTAEFPSGSSPAVWPWRRSVC